jgi:hypothetical protein
LLLVCMGWLLQLKAQQEFFVFIQHEKNQPFYVRMGDRTFSSSALGHVILSRLRDSTYKLSIGFPNNQFPEQEYNVQLNKKDRGFELKNLPEKGWSLFDLSSMELISPVKPGGSNAGGGVAFIKRNDDFARLMSGVVNDTAVLYVAAVVEKKPDVAKKVDPVVTDVPKESQKTDSALTGTADVAKNEAATETKKAGDSSIAKKTETTSAEQNKKTDVAAIAPAKKIDPASIEQNKKTDPEQVKKSETTSTEQVNPAKKPDTGLPERVNSDTASRELASKNTESSIKELSKAADSTKKVTPAPVNDTVFNPPALPVVTVVRQYATDSGYHMLMMDDKDSVNIFIPGESVVNADNREINKDSTQEKPGRVKKWLNNLGRINPFANKNEDKPAKNEADNKANPDTRSTNPDPNKSANPDKPAIDKPLENKTPEKKLSDQNTSPAKDNSAAAKPAVVVPKAADDTTRKPTKLVMVNSDCRAVAGSSDLDKLRVKLIQEKDAESRISAARKVFKTKCFTAAQIKALSELFPYDDQKYQFLEAAYPFVYDTSSFKELVSLLDDPSYVSRFRKMVRLD